MSTACFSVCVAALTLRNNQPKKAADSGSTSRIVAMLVKPSCLIVDEVGRCTFDKACTDLFFDIVDRRNEKDCANTMILTSNTPTNNWDEFFTGDDTLLRTQSSS